MDRIGYGWPSGSAVEPMCAGAATVAPISDESAPLRSDSTAGGDTADANAVAALPLSEADGVAPTDSENATTNVRR